MSTLTGLTFGIFQLSVVVQRLTIKCGAPKARYLILTDILKCTKYYCLNSQIILAQKKKYRTYIKVAGVGCFGLLHILKPKLKVASNLIKSALKVAKQLLEILLYEKFICLFNFRKRLHVIICSINQKKNA